MTQIINDIGDYSERVTINPIKALPGKFHVRVETRHTASRNPDAWRTVYQTTCEQWGLEAFGKEIYNAVMVQSE